jgi:hypothetical protein
MGAYGAIAPVLGAGLGGAAEESAEQVAGAGARKVTGQPVGSPDYGAVKDKAITGMEGEMGGQILGKAIDFGGSMINSGKSAIGKGVDAFKDYFSLGDTPAIKPPGPPPPPAAPAVPESAPVAANQAAGPATPKPKPVPTGKLVTQAMNEQFGVKPPEPGKPIFSRDSMGIKWAEGPGGVKVSIPDSVPEEQAAGYAQQKLSEQAAMRSKLKPLGADVSEAEQQPAAGPRIQTPSRNETLLENMKNRVPGSNPLEKDVPLKEQPVSPERTPAQVKEETVHPMDRQIIHSDGAAVLEATKGSPQMTEDLHALENEQLREVLRKSGEDMGTKRVGSTGKTADPNDFTRQEAFEILLKEKGMTPEQILKEAPPRSKPAKARVPFGPKR